MEQMGSQSLKKGEPRIKCVVIPTLFTWSGCLVCTYSTSWLFHFKSIGVQSQNDENCVQTYMDWTVNAHFFQTQFVMQAFVKKKSDPALKLDSLACTKQLFLAPNPWCVSCRWFLSVWSSRHVRPAGSEEGGNNRSHGGYEGLFYLQALWLTSSCLCCSLSCSTDWHAFSPS